MLAYLSISLIEVASYPPRSGDRGNSNMRPRTPTRGGGGGWLGGEGYLSRFLTGRFRLKVQPLTH